MSQVIESPAPAPSASVSFTGVTPVLPAGKDVEATIAFYVEKLGFTKQFDSSFLIPNEPISYAGITRDGIGIHLFAYDDPKIAPMSHLRINIPVGSGEALQAEFAARGLTVAAPEMKPWGVKELTVTDPNGVSLYFAEFECMGR